MTKPILGGAPLKFETPEELKAVLQEYFDTTEPEEYTVTGLALKVGSKQLLNDYEERDGFKELVTTAKLIIENGYEIDLKKFGRSGTIFALKNFNWKDKTEQDITSAGKPIPLMNNVLTNNQSQEDSSTE